MGTKIGALIVAPDTTPELEFPKFVPEGVSVHFTRMQFPGSVDIESLEKLAYEGEEACKLLAPLKVDVVAFCCTSGSFIKGVGYDEEIANKIKEKIPGATAITTTTAVVNALQDLGVNRIGIATPYTDDLNKVAKTFFEKMGFKVLNLEGLNILDDLEIGRQPPQVAYELAKKTDTPEIEGIFISCTNLRTAEILEKLELELHKPVISSNQATIWYALQKANVQKPVYGFGSLLERL